MIFDQMMLIGSSAATKIDFRAIFSIMESFFGNKCDETCRKIRYVLTDSCNAASTSSKLLAAQLDTIARLESSRKLAHIPSFLEKHAFIKLSLIRSGLFLWLHQKTCIRIMLYGKHEDFSTPQILLSGSKCIDCIS